MNTLEVLDSICQVAIDDNFINSTSVADDYMLALNQKTQYPHFNVAFTQNITQDKLESKQRALTCMIVDKVNKSDDERAKLLKISRCEEAAQRLIAQINELNGKNRIVFPISASLLHNEMTSTLVDNTVGYAFDIVLRTSAC